MRIYIPNPLVAVAFWGFVAALFYFFPWIMGGLLCIGIAGLIIVWARSQIYFLMHAGNLLLVVDGQHGWREVIENNLLPVAPDNVQIVWAHEESASRFHAIALPDCTEQRPFIALITRRGAKTTSLHEQMLPFKTQGKREVAVQDELKRLLLQNIENLRRMHGYYAV